jgi:Fe-S-cluster containining protein|tara:strand:+ start:70 stop:471 length:402 start_codon:yes stop_codon:yes gene_type:complete
MGVDCNICSTKCFGIDNYHGSCCSLEDRDYIIGPHYDSKEFIERLSERFGREIKHNEVFIEWAEGSKMFPDKTVWQNPANFPALRVDENQPRLPCTFYNTKIKACTVHSIRPNTCAAYECDYLAKQTNKNKIK